LLAPLLKRVDHRAEVRVERDPFENEEFLATQPLKLTEEQQSVHKCVLATLQQPAEAKPSPLHGVSGQAARPRSSSKPSPT